MQRFFFKFLNSYSTCLYVALLFLFSVFGNKIFLVIASILCLVYLINISWRFKYIFFILLVMISIATSSFFWNFQFYQPMFFFLISSLSGIFLYQNPPSKVGATLVFLLVLVYFVFCFINFSNLNESVFASNSKNFISVWMIVSSLLVYASNVSRNIRLLVFAFSFVISCLALGRSGIIATAIILFGSLFFSETKHRTKEIVVFLSLISVFILINYEYLMLFFDTVISRFESARNIDPREHVLQCYIESFNILRLFFGLNASGGDICGTLAIGEYAPHNSFISLYSNVGIFSFVYLGVIVVKRTSRELKLIFLGLLVRSSTDSVLFFTYFDFIYIFLILKVYHLEKRYNDY